MEKIILAPLVGLMMLSPLVVSAQVVPATSGDIQSIKDQISALKVQLQIQLLLEKIAELKAQIDQILANQNKIQDNAQQVTTSLPLGTTATQETIPTCTISHGGCLQIIGGSVTAAGKSFFGTSTYSILAKDSYKFADNANVSNTVDGVEKFSIIRLSQDHKKIDVLIAIPFGATEMTLIIPNLVDENGNEVMGSGVTRVLN